MLPAGLYPGQPLIPYAGSLGSAAALPNQGLAAAAASAQAASRVVEGQLGCDLLPSASPQPVHSSLQQPQQALTGAAPRKQRGRGRPRADRSRMTEQQLRAIAYTEAHNERKKSHMRDLEERVADVTADLERERAQQENSQQSAAALEGLMRYQDEMVTILQKTGLDSPSTSPAAQGACTPTTSSCASLRAVPPELLPGAGVSTVGRAELEGLEMNGLPEPPGHEEAEAGNGGTASSSSSGTDHCPLCSATGSCNHASRRPEASPSAPVGRGGATGLLPVNSWANKLPATWQYVEAVMRGRGEPPAPLGRGTGASTTATGAVCLPPSLQQHLPQLRRLGQQQPLGFQLHCWKGGCPDWRTICASASPAVVAELQSASAADFVQGWRDYAHDARDILNEFHVTKNEAKAVSQLTPYIAMLAILMNLAMHHNPGCMKQLFMTSAENLSEDQQREKYDGLVAAMDMDPLQQERYQELAEAYTTFVQRARQHKAEALARLGQSAFSSLPASASMGRMVSQYLEALDATAVLSAYPDAELIGLLELIRGHGKILKPLQKATVAAVAYPHFPDLVQIVEALRRLPSPQQQKRLLGSETAAL
ncbi:hypothetical protein N2152v2_010198 [Parachlorella kessleri]